ncbi:MAG: cell division protein SepF [Actinomycetaceae bacterium]|nr:cell division protein SepF [Actinomycetaceae bacterium]
MAVVSRVLDFVGLHDSSIKEENEYDYPETQENSGVTSLYDAQLEEVKAPAPVLARIVTVHPATFNEARTIGERFREGIPVIINLSNLSEPDARRMVDFASGLIFGLHGSIERVTTKVFLISPEVVKVEGATSLGRTTLFNQS